MLLINSNYYLALLICPASRSIVRANCSSALSAVDVVLGPALVTPPVHFLDSDLAAMILSCSNYSVIKKAPEGASHRDHRKDQ